MYLPDGECLSALSHPTSCKNCTYLYKFLYLFGLQVRLPGDLAAK